MNTKLESITLGGGCFWCVEAVFQDIKGVKSVVSGYAGGMIKNPSYREICTGNTGHAEVCEIVFDPSELSLEDLLKVFWTTHDPTTLNRQGNDRGTQYRSVVYYKDEVQRETTKKVLEEFAKDIWDDPIVTEIAERPEFYRAEEYHQNYYKSNPDKGYCSVVISPKVSKFRKAYSHLLTQQEI